jgi:hypothetical protein
MRPGSFQPCPGDGDALVSFYESTARTAEFGSIVKSISAAPQRADLTANPMDQESSFRSDCLRREHSPDESTNWSNNLPLI